MGFVASVMPALAYIKFGCSKTYSFLSTVFEDLQKQANGLEEDALEGNYAIL